MIDERSRIPGDGIAFQGGAHTSVSDGAREVRKPGVETPESPRLQEARTTRVPSSTRLAGVDGLRAIAALWVVLFHIHAFSHVRIAHLPGADLFLRSGYMGVSLFLVLSGFCLYVPFAAGRAARFRTGTFLVRRFWRLMPAYYASLAAVLVLNLGAGGWFGFHTLSPQMAVWQTLTHVTMLHTLFANTSQALNGAYWSLGLEWQWYLGLPLLILGARRWGFKRTMWAAVGCNVLYGLIFGVLRDHGIIAAQSGLATIVLPAQFPARVTEFVLGMLAAELYVSGRIRIWTRQIWAGIILLAPLHFLAADWSVSANVLRILSGTAHDFASGLVFFGLLCLVLCSDNLISTWASWPPLVAVGTMSYSLYLVHQPIVQGMAYVAAAHFHLTPMHTFLFLLALTPAILFAAWVMFMAVERHTLSSKRPSAASHAPAAAQAIPGPAGN